jgi:hypothetical protein
VTAAAPAAGTVFSAVNVDHIADTEDSGLPATTRVGSPIAFAQSSDGTIYFTAGQKIVSFTTDGLLRHVAGDGGAAFAGDGGPAVDATLYFPWGLALDDAADILYVADSSNNRIRAIDLTTNVITTVAGGGSAGPPNYGNGGAATSATLTTPYWVSLGSDGALYVSDRGIRRVDRTTGIIDVFVPQVAICTGQTLVLNGCNGYSCYMEWVGPQMYFTGYLCGTTVGGNAYGIVRRESGGAFTHILGRVGGPTADGTAATMASLVDPRAVAFDGSTLLYVDGYRVRSIVGGNLGTVAGQATGGESGDWGPATSALFDRPEDILVGIDGHLYIADYSNNAIRLVW